MRYHLPDWDILHRVAENHKACLHAFGWANCERCPMQDCCTTLVRMIDSWAMLTSSEITLRSPCAKVLLDEHFNHG